MLFFVLAIGLVGGMLVVIFAIYFSIVRSRVDQHHDTINQRFQAEQNIILKANVHCYGQTSTNGVPLRGRGVLFLTPEDLHFEMSLPPLSWRIPLTTLKNSHAQGSILTVEYISKHGHDKTLAWKVPHAQRWQDTIQQTAAPTTVPQPK